MTQIKGLLDLFFPEYCIHCNKKIRTVGKLPLCMSCEIQLDSAWRDGVKNVLLLNRFKGIMPLHYGFSMLYFTNNGVSQTLIHEAKYHGQTHIFSYYGKILGYKMKQEIHLFEDKPEIVIPVPNNWIKRLKLSYNQAAVFAVEIAKTLDVPMKENILRKARDRSSQTKRSKVERLHELQKMYSLTGNARQVQGRHVLLVDDVITSGATIEICCQLLLQAGVAKISVCSFMLVK